jgi:hypothetical protein
MKLRQYAKQQGMSYSTALRWWHETSPRPAGSPDLLMNQGCACLEGFF